MKHHGNGQSEALRCISYFHLIDRHLLVSALQGVLMTLHLNTQHYYKKKGCVSESLRFLNARSRAITFISLMLFFFPPHCMSYGILVLEPHIKSCPLRWKCQVLTTGPPVRALLNALLIVTLQCLRPQKEKNI